MSRPVPWRRSLVVRLLGTSILIVILSVATTAWLAAKTATRAVQQEREQSLAGDLLIQDTLLGFAAGHRDWAGVEPALRRLAGESGRTIALTTTGGRLIATSDPAAPLPARASALLDPLGGASGPIDPRAVGPYRLTGRDRTAQHELAQQRLGCLRAQGLEATTQEAPSGRLIVRLAQDNPRQERDCPFRDDGPTAPEVRAIKALQTPINQCLKNRHLAEIVLFPVDFTWQFRTPDTHSNTQDVQDCVDAARRAQLRPYVADPARLFLSSPAEPPAPAFDLSRASTLRIAGATGFVLLVAVAAALLVGLRLVRPLRTLTAAADGATHRPAPVSIARADEIGRLAHALNDLAERSERSEQQRRTMVDDIAHELRNPLTNVRNWLTAGQDGLADLDQDMVRLLLEETGLLQHIVDDLSDLADADAGTLALDRAEHSAADLLTSIVEAYPGVHLRTEGELPVVVDPVRFRQIVANLLTNAIRHTPPGGRIDVSARSGGPDVIIEVADTGEGITTADLPHVFDRFWRADRARTRATGGSGLGLSIARKLAQAHGGDLTAASTPGVGSTFTVRLPAQPFRPSNASA